jgi:uroporphyrinogen-III synthase
VPTTAGVIDSLRSEDLTGRRVAVQLYGTDPNESLITFLNSAGARASTVAPYIYASKAADDAVLDLLRQMAAGKVDIIAFTSKSQVDRLFSTAPSELVREALQHTEVAAVGPVVRDALEAHSIQVRFMPQDSFFMKPLTSTIEDGVGK